MTTKRSKQPLTPVFENRRADLTEWELDAVTEFADQLKAIVLKASAEAIHLAMIDEDTFISWPAIWSDAAGLGSGHELEHEPHIYVDPLTVFLQAQLTAMADGTSPRYKYNLRDALKGDIDDCKHDGSFAEGLTRIMKELRSLADEIEAALPKE